MLANSLKDLFLRSPRALRRKKSYVRALIKTNLLSKARKRLKIKVNVNFRLKKDAIIIKRAPGSNRLRNAANVDSRRTISKEIKKSRCRISIGFIESKWL